MRRVMLEAWEGARWEFERGRGGRDGKWRIGEARDRPREWGIVDYKGSRSRTFQASEWDMTE